MQPNDCAEKAVVVSSRPTKAAKITASLTHCKTFLSVQNFGSGMEFLRMLPGTAPTLAFVVAPLPDRIVSHVIQEVRQLSPSTRIIIVADWTELAGFARAQQKGADGFISARLLSAELPLLLARYPEFSRNWGRQFSPWKAGYGMA